VLIAVSCLALGAATSVTPIASLTGVVIGLAMLGRRIGAGWLVAIALCVGVGWARASWLLAEHGRRYDAARALLPAPSRCAASGRVTSSPTQLGGFLRFDAELRGLDCGGSSDGHTIDGPPMDRQTLDEQSWAARLYLPSPSQPLPGTTASSARPHRFASEPRALARGDEISLIAELSPVSEFRNFLLPDPRPGPARRGAVISGAALSLDIDRPATGIPAVIDRARAHVRERILATFGERVAGMARALVLGEADLTPDDERAFARSGLSHLLAVSGTHLILAVLALVRALEALLRRWAWLSARADVRRPAALLGLCLGPLYADFAGGSGSAWRAAWMLGAVLGVRALGRHVFPSRVLAASLAAGWFCDGLVVFDASFSLSIAATTGLLAMGRRLDETMLARAAALTQPRAAELGRLTRALGRAALTTLAATLPCVPILLSMTPGLSLASVAANLLAAPLGEAVALPLCLAHAVCSLLPALERGIALVASGALALIRGVAIAAASVDWLYFEVPPPTAWHLAALFSSLAAWLAAAGRPWLAEGAASRSLGGHGAREARCAPRPGLAWGAVIAGAIAILSIEGFTRWQHSGAHGRARERLRVTALDVGQGDATLIDLPDGRLMLIDGGGFVGIPIDPGERVILPTLRARRRDRIDILVVTHPHPDHFGGLLSVAREIAIGELWYGGPDGEHEASEAERSSERTPTTSPYRELLEMLRQRGVPLRAARDLCPGITLAGAAIRVLHPCPALADGREPNDNSLVLRITHGLHTALLVGDAERWAEQRLVATRASDLGADFLKVGHHGSRTSSSPEFLALVRPRFASISSGIRNRFGHPHPEALANLARAGARVLRLDRLGAIEWQSDGLEQSVRTFLDEEPATIGGFEPPRRQEQPGAPSQIID
jgi:competence protein ComEC